MATPEFYSHPSTLYTEIHMVNTRLPRTSSQLDIPNSMLTIKSWVKAYRGTRNSDGHIYTLMKKPTHFCSILTAETRRQGIKACAGYTCLRSASNPPAIHSNNRPQKGAKWKSRRKIHTNLINSALLSRFTTSQLRLAAQMILKNGHTPELHTRCFI